MVFLERTQQELGDGYCVSGHSQFLEAGLGGNAAKTQRDVDRRELPSWLAFQSKEDMLHRHWLFYSDGKKCETRTVESFSIFQNIILVLLSSTRYIFNRRMSNLPIDQRLILL